MTSPTPEPRVSDEKLKGWWNLGPASGWQEFDDVVHDLVIARQRIAALETALAKPRYCETFAAYGYQCEPSEEEDGE